ncbi:unnamed protein product [Rotaria sp. Silwood2]|nr:unnamed protein product [Rotaria sp. Silwood2]CAF2532630.1 unnamed protein product [Rotaria sp. Silwood2]CAF2785157.1 unnamed protein product [Rotaria sp. Silwood2]CAF2929791.1 unnamed protein product [Rotaria sp. Silwood2]CAF3857377.1 unnamed protein product [Rotaria sp. Silwood2]
MSNENKEFDIYESNKYQKLLPINSLDTSHDQINKQTIIEENFSIQYEESLSSSIYPKEFRNDTNITTNSLELSTLDPKISTQNLTKSDIEISQTSSQLSSSSNIKSIETTKSELIQRILDSFKPSINLKYSSNSTTNTSLSSIDKTFIPCQSLNLSNQIYIYFKDENELGIKPHINDLLEKIDYINKCSCHRIEINFNNHSLNQELSYKQKQSILRIILRRQKIFDQYFSQSQM